jgi:Rrf2 family protein
MNTSNSIGYGLLAVCYIANHKDEKIVTSYTIAEEYGISSLEYLLKIMQALVKANIFRSKRGPRGGFSMARPLNKINMLEIIEGVDGPMTGQLYLREHAPKEKFSIKAEKVYEKALDEARKVLKNTKLSDLI